MSEELSAIIDDMPYNLGRAMELITQAAAEGRKKIVIQPTAATTLNRAIELIRREVDRIEAEPAPIKTTLNMHTDSLMANALGKYAATTHQWVTPPTTEVTGAIRGPFDLERLNNLSEDTPAPITTGGWQEPSLTTRDPEPRGQLFGPGPATHVDGRDPMWDDNPITRDDPLGPHHGPGSWAAPENLHNDEPAQYEVSPDESTEGPTNTRLA